MRILLCPSAFHPHLGGVEELTLRLALELQVLGHSVHVLTNKWPLTLADTETIESIDITRLPFTVPGRHPTRLLAHIRGRKALSRTLQARFRTFDVIHVICASSQTAHLARFARRARKPLVLTTQGETVMDADGLYERSAYARRVLRSASRSAASLTACSEWTREAAADVAPAFKGSQVVLNGVDLSSTVLTEVPEDPRIGAYGRLVPQKGFDLLIQSFAWVRAVVPDAQLLIAGDGPQRAALEAMAGPGVQFLGPLDRAGVADLLKRVRLVVVPSRIEPFGIVAAEASAAGRTVAYSVHGGLSEALNGSGIPVDPFDRAALADSILSGLRNPQEPAECRKAVARLDWPFVASDYERIYTTALAST